MLGYAIVFVALCFLILIFTLVPKVLSLDFKRLLQSRKENKNTENKGVDVVMSGETNAAIAMALCLYFNDLHDEESNVITIKQVKRTYSPWSSKVYGFTNINFPR